MPKPITLDIAPKTTGGYFWIAAFQGQEQTGPFGRGDNPTEAINELVDVTEDMLAEAAL